MKAFKEQGIVCPLKPARASTASDELKVSGMMVNYQWKHFKAVAREEQFYCLPPEALKSLEGILQVQHVESADDPDSSFMMAGGRLKADVAMDDEVRTIEKVECTPFLVFRLLHLNTIVQKSMNELSSMRQDHMAVAVYDVHYVDFQQSKLSVMSQVEKGVTDMSNVRLLSMDGFLKAGWLPIAKDLLQCSPSTNVRYCFVDVVLPQEAKGQIHCDVVTDLVNAEAFPGPCGTMEFNETTRTSEFIACLVAFKELGLVVEILKNRFQITEDGYGRLRQLVDSKEGEKFTRVMQPRVHLPMQQWSHWELIFNLHCHGWQACPSDGRQHPAISCTRELNEDEKVWYFNRTKLDVPAYYLICLSSFPMLAAEGFLFVQKLKVNICDSFQLPFQDAQRSSIDKTLGILQHCWAFK